MPLSDKQRLIEAGLGIPLADFLRLRRDRGNSNRNIAEQLHARTGVPVSYESVRLWLVELDKDAA